MAERGEQQPDVILFDGVCNLCSQAVQFVIARDPNARFRFAPLQSAIADELLGRSGDEEADLESFVLLAHGRQYRKSTAALQVARRLSGLWPLLSVFLIVPRPLRDGVYDFIGRRRYRWFGQKRECWVPVPELRGRFLDSATD